MTYHDEMTGRAVRAYYLKARQDGVRPVDPCPLLSRRVDDRVMLFDAHGELLAVYEVTAGGTFRRVRDLTAYRPTVAV